MTHKVAPSILSCDFGTLKEEIEMLNQSDADWIHLDIMDGVFVPNISFGFPVLEAVAKYANKPLDAHLMIVQPEKFIPDFKDLGVYMLNVHYEACIHLHRVIGEIKKAGIKAAVTLNPHTPVSFLEEIIRDLDMVLLMTVNPGFGGQVYIEHSYDKIKALRSLIDSTGSNALIEIDGGVDEGNAANIVQAGADVLVAGSFVFKSPNPIKTIHKLKNLSF